MLVLQRRIAPQAHADAERALPFELRQKSRLRTALASGEEVGLFLERGTVLRGGDCLESDNGRVVRVDPRRNVVVVSVGIGQWEVGLDEVIPEKK